MELYKYYSTQRPVGPGTYPQPPENQLMGILHYEGRVPVEGGAFHAWGELAYEKALTDRQQYDYELRPSRDNPDVRETMARQAQTVGPWEAYRRVPEEKRVTGFDPAQGVFLPLDGMTPERLNARFNSAQKFPVPRQRRKKSTSQQGER